MDQLNPPSLEDWFHKKWKRLTSNRNLYGQLVNDLHKINIFAGLIIKFSWNHNKKDYLRTRENNTRNLLAFLRITLTRMKWNDLQQNTVLLCKSIKDKEINYFEEKVTETMKLKLFFLYLTLMKILILFWRVKDRSHCSRISENNSIGNQETYYNIVNRNYMYVEYLYSVNLNRKSYKS